ncbi:MAG: calcium/sodium antiporter [Rhizobiales bacterium]|nr:calcium/sodium antiporter [Hyphomicrobiales bacterium]
MSLMMLIAGLAILVVTGDAFIRAAVSVALRLNVPMLVVGLTIVAFGTSAPELVVSLNAALTGSPGIAVGNIVGSNIANVLLVLGLPALLAKTSCDQPFIRSNLFFMLGASLLFIAFCMSGTLEHWHGLVLFFMLVVFLGILAYRTTVLGAPADVVEEAAEIAEKPMSNGLVALFLLIGLIGMPFGAHLTVHGASALARQLGVDEATIGLTIVAVGTSLPELATTLMAALRSRAGLALGNVLGSNIFNILGIMGVTAIVTPVPVPKIMLELDLWIMLGASLMLVPFIFNRLCITRLAGVAFLGIYATYLAVVYAPGHSVGAAEIATKPTPAPMGVGVSYQARP